MLKNSITLIETLVSLIILSTVVIGFLKTSYNSKKNENTFYILNDLENSFDTKDYSNLTQTNSTLQIIKNDSLIENIDVKKYEYQNNNIKVFKYEK